MPEKTFDAPSNVKNINTGNPVIQEYSLTKHAYLEYDQ